MSSSRHYLFTNWYIFCIITLGGLTMIVKNDTNTSQFVSALYKDASNSSNIPTISYTVNRRYLGSDWVIPNQHVLNEMRNGNPNNIIYNKIQNDEFIVLCNIYELIKSDGSASNEFIPITLTTIKRMQ